MSNFQRRVVQSNYDSYSAQGTLTNASAALLTAGSHDVLIVDTILLTEYSNNARTVTLRHVDSGDTDDATANFLTDLALAANETFEETFGGNGGIVLRAGAALKGLASANTSVNYLISYRKEA
jgi:hypothetical protein